jgi:hypothetical protein
MGKKKVQPNYRRRTLRRPDLDHSKLAVLNSLRSPGSRRVYEFALDPFIAWYCSEPRLAFNRIVVTRYHVGNVGSDGTFPNYLSDRWTRVQVSLRDATCFVPYPALKRRAIVVCPAGTFMRVGDEADECVRPYTTSSCKPGVKQSRAENPATSIGQGKISAGICAEA